MCAATVSDDARPGVVVAPMGWWSSDYEGGVGAQATTSQRLTELGAAPTFNDNRVEVEKALMSDGYAASKIDDLPDLWDGFARLVRAGLDVTAFGCQVMDLPPDYSTKSHDECRHGPGGDLLRAAGLGGRPDRRRGPQADPGPRPRGQGLGGNGPHADERPRRDARPVRGRSPGEGLRAAGLDRGAVTSAAALVQRFRLSLRGRGLQARTATQSPSAIDPAVVVLANRWIVRLGRNRVTHAVQYHADQTSGR